MSENADGRRRSGTLVGRAAERETIDTLLADAGVRRAVPSFTSA